MEDEQALELANSVLDRCISYGGVVHIYVDRKSTFVSSLSLFLTLFPEDSVCTVPSVIFLEIARALAIP